MIVLYEDDNIAICQKPIGVISQSTKASDGFADIAAKEFGYAAIINRLDTQVGGAVLFAKNKESAACLSSLMQDKKITKTYLAVVIGEIKEKTGIYEDLLFKDSSKNKSFVVKKERKGVKKAKLEYEVAQETVFEGKLYSLVRVKPHTGRSHQIRVQFASRKTPLAGDGKYGSFDNKCTVALWSHSIETTYEKKHIFTVSYPPKDSYPWNLFNI